MRSTGKVIWSHNTSTDTDAGSADLGHLELAARRRRRGDRQRRRHAAGYDVATGKQRWIGPAARRQLQLAAPRHDRRRDAGRDSQRARSGERRIPPTANCCGNYKWEGGAIVQPAITDDGDILINAMSATGGIGTQRLTIKHDASGWTPEERWTSNGLKPYFNDYVIHKGHAYGFDNNILVVHRSRRRQAQVEGRTLRQRPDVAARRSGSAARDVGRRRARARQRDDRSVQGDREDSRSSTRRPGTIRWSSATCCWSGTARRWRRSASPPNVRAPATNAEIRDQGSGIRDSARSPAAPRCCRRAPAESSRRSPAPRRDWQRRSDRNRRAALSSPQTARR